MTRLWERIGLGLLVVLLLAAGYNGLVEGTNELHNEDTPWMRVATATQLLYGASGPEGQRASGPEGQRARGEEKI